MTTPVPMGKSSGAGRAGPHAQQDGDAKRAIDELLASPARERTPRCELDAVDMAERIYAARQLRPRHLDYPAFGEPAWDMLLLAYCAGIRGRTLSLALLSSGANVSLSVGTRWIAYLEQNGLVNRRFDQFDRARDMVELTALGRSRLYDCINGMSDILWAGQRPSLTRTPADLDP